MTKGTKWRAMFRAALSAGSILNVWGILALAPGTAFAQGAGVEIEEPHIPPGVDVFNLNLRQTRHFSRSNNFEVVAHSYFRGPWLTPFAQTNGLGAGFNTPRVYNGIAYLGGYNGPPTLFGILIADVRELGDDSSHGHHGHEHELGVLSFIPCKPGTRCPYLRVNPQRNILIFGNSHDTSNPIQPPMGQPSDSGWSFWDVSHPRHPIRLSHLSTLADGTTHGMEIDDRYLYGCGQTVAGTRADELTIIDYANPSAPVVVSTLHIQGQRPGENFAPQDQLNPDGTPQHVSCHEITFHKDRLYIAYRDAGMVIVDVTDRSSPNIIGRLDYVPPFNGGSLGAAHTSAPVVTDPNEHPTLIVHTDEIFDCPPGFGRIMDVSDMLNPQVVNGERPANLQVISNYRLPFIDDVFDFATERFVCPSGSLTSHLPWFDFRSPSLVYQAWYSEGLRVWDISNPFLPREVGYYLSPPYICGPFTSSCGGGPPPVLRHTRETFQDPDTGLIYMTDGNGGGLTVLRWTGPIPSNPPIPGAR